MSEINKQVDVSNVLVDRGQVTKQSGTMSSILNDRTSVNEIINTQKESISSASKQLNDYSNQMDSFINSLDDHTKSTLKSTEAFKNYNKVIKEASELFGQLVELQENGTADAKELNDIHVKLKKTLLDQEEAVNIMNTVYDKEHKVVKKNNKALQDRISLIKAGTKSQKDAIDKFSKEVEKKITNSNKSISDAFKTNVSHLRGVLKDFKQTMDLSKIASMTDRSSASKVQEQLQRAYGLDKSEFRNFKRDVASSINTSTYSSKEVMKVYGELLDMGIGNVDTASKQFNTLLQGQSLLSLQSDTQAKLIELGNKTGRDQLQFSTNRVAQYMKTATNLSKAQLNELTSINATLMSQLADIGINSETADKTLNDVTVGLDNYMKGDSTLSNTYRNVLSSTATSTERAANEFGMSTEEFKSYANNGNSLFDAITSNGAGVAQQLYRMYKQNYDEAIKQSHYYVEGGTLSSDTASLVKNMVDIEKTTGKSMQQILQQYQTNNLSDKELKDLEKARNDQLTGIDKWVNSLANSGIANVDWNFYNKLDKSLDMIIYLLSAIETSSLLKDMSSIFKGGTLKSLFSNGGSKIASTKLGSKLFTTNASGAISGLSSTGTALGLAGTAAYMGINAFQGWNNKELTGTNASNGDKLLASMLSLTAGAKVHRTASGNVDYAQNIGKGALGSAGMGALLGTVIAGPGLGTVIGGIAGGLIGSITGGAKAKRAQQIQEEQLKQQELIAKNTSKTADTVRDITTITAANRTVPSYVAKASGDVHPSVIHTTHSAGDMYNGYDISPYKFSSPYISAEMAKTQGRAVYKNGKLISSGQHHGIDFAAPEGTPIGAAASGIVVFSGHESENGGWKGGGYQTRIKGYDGLTYAYAHQVRRPPVKVGQAVDQGQVIGYVGQTGIASGPHLHFGLYNGNKEMDPTPYVNSSIFTTSGGGVSLYSADSVNTSSNAAIDKATLGKSYSYTLSNMGDMTASNNPVVAGLSQINQTLIDLANKQSRDEQILNMLTRQYKQDPVF